MIGFTIGPCSCNRKGEVNVCRWAEEWFNPEPDEDALVGRASAVPAAVDGFELTLDGPTPKLLRADEVAARLRCDVSTVYDMVWSGRLKGFSLTGNLDPNKRGRKALRIFAWSVDALISGGVAEHEVARKRPPCPAPAQAVEVTLPPPLPNTKPSRRAGSRVLLPPPS
jgi:hypothetical protein